MSLRCLIEHLGESGLRWSSGVYRLTQGPSAEMLFKITSPEENKSGPGAVPLVQPEGSNRRQRATKSAEKGG